jgi:hypothetical protein
MSSKGLRKVKSAIVFRETVVHTQRAPGVLLCPLIAEVIDKLLPLLSRGHGNS